MNKVIYIVDEQKIEVVQNTVPQVGNKVSFDSKFFNVSKDVVLRVLDIEHCIGLNNEESFIRITLQKHGELKK